MNPHVSRAVGAVHEQVLALQALRSIARPDELEEIDAALKYLQAANAAIVAGEGVRIEAARKTREHTEIVPLCRQAQDKLRRIEREYERCHPPVQNAEAHLRKNPSEAH